MSPQPTHDVAQAMAQLDEHGLALLAGALTDDEVRDARARLEAAVLASEADEVPTRGYAFDCDDINRRVFQLFNLDPLFIDLVQRAPALDFVRHSLGASFLISNFSANITAPGSQRMLLHADQGYVDTLWSGPALACNVGWLLDDFTVENGGTCYVPGSHRAGRGPRRDEAVETVAIEAPAGSMLVMDGRLWHQTGANHSANSQRAALFGYYVVRWLRPQINWNAALWPEVAAAMTPEFLDLLGYYTGNTEYQIPCGRRATVRRPAALQAMQDGGHALHGGGVRRGAG